MKIIKLSRNVGLYVLLIILATLVLLQFFNVLNKARQAVSGPSPTPKVTAAPAKDGSTMTSTSNSSSPGANGSTNHTSTTSTTTTSNTPASTRATPNATPTPSPTPAAIIVPLP